MPHFRNNTCESCKWFDSEFYMEGPGVCVKRKLVVWPTNKCRDYGQCSYRGRGYSRADDVRETVL